MVLDIAAITIIIIFFVRGYRKGIIVAALSVVAIILGIICSLKLSERLATYLFEQGYVTSGWAQLVSYVALFVGVIWLVRITAKAIESGMDAVMLGWVNRSIGGLLYGFLSLVIISSLLWVGREMQLLKPEMIAKSKTYEYIEPVAPFVAEKVGYLWPMAKEVFADLQTFFSNVNQYIPTSVDTH